MSSLTANAMAMGVGVGVHGGLLGSGVTGTLEINKAFSLRAGNNAFSIANNFTADNVDYAADLNLDSFFAFADWHIFNGSMRLTAGMISNNNNLSASATTNAQNFNASAPSTDVGVKADVKYSGASPYIGFGWGDGNPRNRGLKFGFDLGFLMQETPDVAYEQTSGQSAYTMSQTEKDDAAKEIQDALTNLKIYPVAAFSISYHF